MLRKECPKYLIDLKKVKDEKNDKGFEMSNDEIKLLYPAFVEDLRYKVRERNVEADRIFKDDDLSEELFPIKIMVAYRTTTELKFGVFDLAGRRTP